MPFKVHEIFLIDVSNKDLISAGASGRQRLEGSYTFRLSPIHPFNFEIRLLLKSQSDRSSLFDLFPSNSITRGNDNKSSHFATLSAHAPKRIKWLPDTEKITALSIRTSPYNRKCGPVAEISWHTTKKGE